MPASSVFPVTLAALGLVLVGAGAAAQETADPPPPAAPEAASAVAALQRAPSPTYYLLRPDTRARSGPSTTAPIVSTLSDTGKPLTALGLVFDGDPASFRGLKPEFSLGRTWIKLRLPSGATGFVSLADLVTPQQLSARAGSSKKLALFDAAASTARRIQGPDIPSGIYTHGGSCDAPQAADADLGPFLASKVLIWQEGLTMHFVRALKPDDPTVYAMESDNQVRELQGYGYVPMRTFRSPKDAALMGYKDKLLWFTTDGLSFDSYLHCDERAYGSVASALRSYAGQRPPDTRG